jgi:2-iminobutanoate/2-iminopropanoate deaminase
MTVREVRSVKATAPQGPYSQAIRAGDFLFVSGAGPLDTTGQLVGDDIREQAVATLRNLEEVLTSAGASFRNVVKATVFLSKMDDYQEFNDAYREFASPPFPARTCVAAGGLYHGILVEIDLIAFLGTEETAAKQKPGG